MEVDKIIQCNVLEGIPLPDKSVHCVVCSPPYWSLRDYGVAGQLGLEKTPEEYIERMVGVFRHVWRVLRDDGTCWMNIGDSYWNGGAEKRDGGNGFVDGGKKKLEANKGARLSAKCSADLKPKDLCMMPARLAIALQAAGWYLRSDIIWAKPNPMPESVTDRPTKSHEHLFLLTKKPKYFYDSEAIREPSEYPDDDRKGRVGMYNRQPDGQMNYVREGTAQYPTRNKRDVWTIPTQSFPEAHFATFPEKLVEPCIKAGTSEKGCCPECGSPWVRVVEKSGGTTGESWHDHKNDIGAGFAQTKDGVPLSTAKTRKEKENPYKVETIGWKPTCEHFDDMTFPDIRKNQKVVPSLSAIPCTVYDPFGGAMTTCLVAYKLNRHYIATELNQEYIEMGRKRLEAEKDKFSLFE